MMQQSILMIIGLLSAINLRAADSQPALILDYTHPSDLPVFMYDQEGSYAIPVFEKRPFALSLWSIDEKSHKPFLAHEPQEMVSHVILMPHGQKVITAIQDSISLWIIEAGQLHKKGSIKASAGVLSMGLGRHGGTLVVQDSFGNFLIYEVSDSSLELVIKRLPNVSMLTNPQGVGGLFSSLLSKDVEPALLAVHPEGNAFVVGDREGFVTTYLIGHQSIIGVSKTQVFKDTAIAALSFVSESSLIVQSLKGDIETWRFSNGMLSNAHVLRAGSEQANKGRISARFSLSQNGKHIISLDRDGTLILWVLDAQGWQRARELCHPQQTGYQDAFFADGLPVLWDTAHERAWVITKY